MMPRRGGDGLIALFLLAVPAGLLMAAPAPAPRPVTADVVLGMRNSKDMKSLAAHLRSPEFLAKAIALVPEVAALQGKSDSAKWLQSKMRLQPTASGVRVIVAGIDNKDALALLGAIADQHLADRNPGRERYLQDMGKVAVEQLGGRMIIQQQRLVVLGGRRRLVEMPADGGVPGKDREAVRNYMRQIDQSQGDGVIVQQPRLDSQAPRPASSRATDVQLQRLRELELRRRR